MEVAFLSGELVFPLAEFYLLRVNGICGNIMLFSGQKKGRRFYVVLICEDIDSLTLTTSPFSFTYFFFNTI